MGCVFSTRKQDKLYKGGINEYFPPEVLANIFRYVSIEEQLTVLSKVCMLWRNIVLDLCSVRKYLCFSKSIQELVRSHKNIFASIEQLDINITNHEIFTDLTILLKSLKKLKVLRVGFYLKGQGTNTSQLAWPRGKACLTSLCCSIEALEVVDCCRLTDRLTDRNTAGKLAVMLLRHIAETSSNTLKYLEYRRVRVPEDNRDAILQLIAHFTHLEVLNLYGCWLGTSVDRLSVSCRSLVELKSLDIRRSHILSTSELLTNITDSCPYIEYLGISPNIVASRVSISNLVHCTKLTNISLENCYINPDNFDNILKLLEMALEVKEIKVGYFTDANMMLALARISFPCLEELDIYRSPNLVTNELLLEFVCRMPKLKRLIISRCQKLTNEGIFAAVNLLSHLQYINAGYNKNIDDQLVELLSDVERATLLTINVYACALSEQRGENSQKNVYIGKNQNICIKWGL